MEDTNIILEKKLETLENEVKDMKLMLKRVQSFPEGKKIVKLGGTLKGMEVSEDDIKEAKRALFRTEG